MCSFISPNVFAESDFILLRKKNICYIFLCFLHQVPLKFKCLVLMFLIIMWLVEAKEDQIDKVV